MPRQREPRRLGTAGLGKLSSLGDDNSGFYHSRKKLQSPRYDQRFRRDVEAACKLGPYAVACLLEQIAAGADLRETVKEYAALDGDFIRGMGGGRFPPNLSAIGGGP